MKRILVVLALLIVCGMAYSVSGKVYGRLLANVNGPSTNDGPTDFNGDGTMGFYDSEPWTHWKTTPLGDLRVGRQGTGVTANFEGFGLDYKLRKPIKVDLARKLALGWDPGFWGLSDLVGHYNAITGEAVSTATSPGYLQVNGIKAGPIDLSIGGAWWTLNRTVSKVQTNANVTNDFNIGYNMGAFDLTYSINLGSISIKAAPWNKVNFAIWSGSDSTKTVAATNSASVNGWGLVLPWEIDATFEQLSVGLHGKLITDSKNKKIFAATTNEAQVSTLEVGTVLKLDYTVNEMFNVYADAGIILFKKTTFETTINGTVTTTNANKVDDEGMEAPVIGGITVKVSPAWTINLGIGYAFEIDRKSYDLLANPTNYSSTDSHFQNMWDNYTIHFYHKPLIKIGTDTKFGDFGAGLKLVVALNSGGMGSDATSDSAKHNSVGVMKDNVSDWLNFRNFASWDAFGGSQAYLSYAKDDFEIKGIFGAGDGAGSLVGQKNASGLLAGLFGAIDIGIKY